MKPELEAARLSDFRWTLALPQSIQFCRARTFVCCGFRVGCLGSASFAPLREPAGISVTTLARTSIHQSWNVPDKNRLARAHASLIVKTQALCILSVVELSLIVTQAF